MAENRPVSAVASDYSTPAASLPALDAPLEPPRASYLNPGPSINDSPRDSLAPSVTGQDNDKESGHTPALSAVLLPAAKDSEAVPSSDAPRSPFYRRPVWLAIALGALVALILIIILPVYFTVIHKSSGSQSNISNNSGSPAPSSSTTTNANAPRPTSTPNPNAITGGDGSTIISGNTTFVYSNAFGGIWYQDPNDPFNNNAYPNSWTPPLNTSWNWATNKVFGVNLGGLFVLEPFITPALFEKYPTATDEWSISVAMAADTGPGGGLQSQLEAHYDTFVTEQDIAQIAGAGLNWIRVPIPFWAIEVWPGEPFLAQVCWKYILRLFEWARKYGIRILLDLHTIPGSQNAFNHSGRGGQINFMNGIMGIANAQRTLDYIRIITEFISQPQYRELIPVFGIINEPLISTIGRPQLTAFYLHAYNIIRGITGVGDGNGPYISIHDGFTGVAAWANFLPGADRIMLDTHPYFAFNGQTNTAPITGNDGSGAQGGIWPKQACAWAGDIKTSQTGFGVTISGEFSSGYTPCGLFLLGTGDATTVQGTCLPSIQWQTWTPDIKAGVREFTLASMDALQNWFFWTWKVGNSSVSGTVESPLWSYQLGLENGWIPTDPRAAQGVCETLGVANGPFSGAYSAWQTGGAGAGTIDPAVAALYPWPPTTLSGVAGDIYAALPTYTPTGVISTLPPPQLTPSVSEGDGWFNPQDAAGAMVTVAGCSYPNAWDSVGAVAPTVACPAGAGVVTAPPRVPTTAAVTSRAVATTVA